jgi:hypothetical protein
MTFFLQNMQNKPKKPHKAVWHRIAQGDKKQVQKCGGQSSLRGEGYSESH